MLGVAAEINADRQQDQKKRKKKGIVTDNDTTSVGQEWYHPRRMAAGIFTDLDAYTQNPLVSEQWENSKLVVFCGGEYAASGGWISSLWLLDRENVGA